jgi:glyoxylase-like metal-dependent hydrolase (beta-lactamase superfamily II)
VKRARLFFVAGLLLAGCVSTPPEKAAVDQAAAALGGAEKIQAVNTLIVEGTGENGNLGQSQKPDALDVFQVSESKRVYDFSGGRQRLEQTRIATFGAPNPQPQKQNLGLDGDVAYNVAANGTATRASAQVAKDRRMELYHHPIGAIRAALTQGAQLSNPRKEGNDDAVDVATAQGDRFTLFVESGTKLPSKVVSTTSNNTNWPIGDVTLETDFANYMDVDGLKLPGKITSKTDRYTTADIQVAKNTVNGDAASLAAPEAAKSAAAPDLPPPMVTAQEISKGIWYLAGQSHHSVLVEFADHLALIEAPQNEVRTGAVLAKVKELKPDKPLKYVVNTHHHFDHSGGVRRAMAEDGVTLITHAGNKAFFEEIAKRPSSIYPDTLSKAPKTPTIEAVTDKYELKDATRTVEIYNIPNLHSQTMLMVYFPAERFLIEADLYNPPAPPAANAPPPAPNAPPPAAPFAQSVVDAVDKLGLRVDRVVPIHGPIVPYRNLQTAARAAATS